MRKQVVAVAIGGTVLGLVVVGVTGIAVAAARGGGSAADARPGARPGDAAATPSSPARPAAPLRVVAVAHPGSAASAGPAVQLGAVTVTFSAAAPAVTPTLVPALAGSWTHPTPTTARFVPAATPVPGTTYAVSVAAGTTDAAGGRLAEAWRASWQTRAGSAARLQQLLAEAGYLPLTFRPATAEPATAAGVDATAYAPVAGTYAWRFTAPTGLQDLYTGATSTLLTRGAVLAFEADHGLATDGVAGPQVWHALTADAAARTVTAAPYTYVAVTKSLPETLTLYREGAAVLTTKANTGVAAAPTPDGSWAVYARYRSETMSGTNPDGSHYSDPGVPWISYFLGGDAVHGFPRSDYGHPQSVGCVELPIATAAAVYGLMGYGDIVTVSG